MPIDAQSRDGQYGRVDTQKMYDNVMNKYIFTGWDDPRVYLDENHRRMGLNLRNNLTRLASALYEGDTAKAVEVLTKLLLLCLMTGFLIISSHCLSLKTITKQENLKKEIR